MVVMNLEQVGAIVFGLGLAVLFLTPRLNGLGDEGRRVFYYIAKG